jgi:ABC-2 type transport system ATP-binding protein
MATDLPVIDLQNVKKVYGKKVHALRGVTMRVHPGEISGLLGPNGAGKSTLVKIMMTVVRPTFAGGTVLGQKIGHKPTLARVGYLPEQHKFPSYFTGRQMLHYYAALSKVDRPTRTRRAEELLELVGLKDWGNAKVNTYSKGMQQRIGLAQALMNDPDLVLLDEPTDGLDPLGRRTVREILVRLRDEGKTVLLNSHLLGEVENVCDRVAILVQGQVARQGKLDELTADTQHFIISVAEIPSETLVATLREAIPCPLEVVQRQVPFQPDKLVEAAHGVLPTGEVIIQTEANIEVRTGDPAKIQPILDALRSRNLTIRQVASVRQSLEDVFMGAITPLEAS